MTSPQEDLKALQKSLAQTEAAPATDANLPPKLEEIYAPAGHESALDPERPLVVGGRGVGKSFWASALIADDTRKLIASSYPRLGLDRCRVALGFGGIDTAEGGAPSREVLDQLISKDRHEPEAIWRAVFLRAVSSATNESVPSRWTGPDGIVAWASSDSERLQTTLRRADEQLGSARRTAVVVFDALDRLGSNWKDIGDRTRALLRVALAMRSYRAIKPKIFMRVDQAEDPSLTSFPDASKLMSGRVDLVWERHDLFGLVFSILAKNAESRKPFRRLVLEQLRVSIPADPAAQLPQELRDEQKQEALFTALAGPYMGSDRRRGKTYFWLYNHLSDAFGRVSPRSFLEAMRVAAIKTVTADRVVDPKGLQVGLQAASRLRVEQLREEFAWIRNALEPLADLRVPCADTQLFERWRGTETIAVIRKSATHDGFLEPIEFTSSSGNDEQALLEAMRRIGVAERRADKRINVPDIYRVAARLLRYGGVRPS